MAAGLGFKDFTTGEVLTAADVDGYLMQGVWVFASAAARDAAVTSPQEGNFAYLKDTNVTTYYTGSAWTNLDTTGMVNPMTTTGDTIYSSSGSTPARLGIGSTGQVLTVSGGLPVWATPSSSPSFVGCVLTKDAAQAMTANVYQAITFSSEVIDTDGFHDNSTNNSRITIPSGKAGKYLVSISAMLFSSDNYIVVYKNGVAERLGAGNYTGLKSLTVVLDLAVGDYIELQVYVNSTANGSYFNFAAVYLGA